MKPPLLVRAVAALHSLPQTSIVGKTTGQIPSLRRRLSVPARGPMRRITGRVPDSIAVDSIAAELPGRVLTVRRYRPRATRTSRPVVVDFHGGGYVIGSPNIKDWFNGHLAARLDAIVLSVDYRLAPEYPFPAAYDDAVDAVSWAGKCATDWGGDAERLIVAGDSSGGTLAAAVGLAGARGEAPPLTAQVLLYPGTDLINTYPSSVECANAPMLSTAEIEAYLRHYATRDQLSDPRVSPLLAPSHHGAPPAVIINSEHDPVRDQGPAYARALRAAGVPARQTTYAGTAHGFLSTPGINPAAPHALTEVVDELRRVLAESPRLSPPSHPSPRESEHEH
jgi:acetyl esterase/lipase